MKPTEQEKWAAILGFWGEIEGAKVNKINEQINTERNKKYKIKYKR